MAKIRFQAPFWANSIFYHSLFDGLRSYLNNISLFLDNEASRLTQTQPEELDDEQSEAEHSIAIEQFENDFPVLLCNSFLILLVSTLEREISTYCTTVAKVSNPEIKSFNLRGSFY